ncbi:MAG: hypothetical protein AAB593_01785 [Patescibacteria group bacterium]
MEKSTKETMNNSNISTPKTKDILKIWRNTKGSWNNKKINPIKQQKKMPRQWSRF